MSVPKILRTGAAALTWPLQKRLATLVYPPGTSTSDFLQPAGEPAVLAADSLSWRIFNNPVAMFVGGVTAVLLELAEPRVRTGVWEHTTFREFPLLRLQRTGYAAMMTVFAARSRTETMVARINAGHARIAGSTPTGTRYRASDVDLLTWVHATAAFGFLQGYTRCVRPLPAAQRDRFWAENIEPARLYGVVTPPQSEREFEAWLDQMHPRLEPSGILREFLALMQGVALLPTPLRGLQRLLIRVAVQNLPTRTRIHLGLVESAWDVSPWQWTLVRLLGRIADHLTLPTWPALLARQRLDAPT